MLEEAHAAGLATLAEGFADRAYTSGRTLAPRDLADAMIEDPVRAAEQALHIARGESIAAVDGARITVAAQTICIHGDTPGALQIARAVRAALEQAGIAVGTP
jgi:UPF0271 protein